MLKVVDKLRKTYIPLKKTDEPKEIITKVRTHPNASHRFQFYVKNKRWCNDEDFADLGDVGHFVEKTFAHYPGPKTVDILIGGPPCQGFSPLARNSTKDLTTEKNRYLTVFLALVDFLKPKYVLIENVPNMLSSKAPLVINKFFNDINYNVHMGELNATQFGLPQMRARVFVWACDGGRKLPKFPRPQYAYQRNTATIKESRRFLVAQPGLNIGAPLPPLNLRDFLSDLPVNDNNTLEKDLVILIIVTNMNRTMQQNP
jgi:site-specific DNA-cytosine methylase